MAGLNPASRAEWRLDIPRSAPTEWESKADFFKWVEESREAKALAEWIEVRVLLWLLRARGHLQLTLQATM